MDPKQLFPESPLESSLAFGSHLHFKREDLSPVHSFKWRGAFAALSERLASGITRVVTASAGNHAQGVAATAHALGMHARIFMPVSTPEVKIDAVRELGGDAVDIVLFGRSYDDAFGAAADEARRTAVPLVHPFDEPAVIRGNASMAEEISRQMGGRRLDVAYLQIGGGGMAAGVGVALRAVYPNVHLIGVEAEGQASMDAAFKSGGPVDLATVDGFCDGTAVRRAGRLTYAVCKKVLSEMIRVSNDEVCQAMETLWGLKRVVAEPAGVLGFAGFLTQRYHHQGKNVLVVVSGANMDFQKIAWVSNREPLYA